MNRYQRLAFVGLALWALLFLVQIVISGPLHQPQYGRLSGAAVGFLGVALLVFALAKMERGEYDPTQTVLDTAAMTFLTSFPVYALLSGLQVSGPLRLTIAGTALLVALAFIVGTNQVPRWRPTLLKTVLAWGMVASIWLAVYALGSAVVWGAAGEPDTGQALASAALFLALMAFAGWFHGEYGSTWQSGVSRAVTAFIMALGSIPIILFYDSYHENGLGVMALWLWVVTAIQVWDWARLTPIARFRRTKQRASSDQPDAVASSR